MQPGGFTIPLRQQLISVQTRDQLSLFDNVPLIDSSFYQATRCLERNVYLGQFNVSRYYDLIVGILPVPVGKQQIGSKRGQQH